MSTRSRITKLLALAQQPTIPPAALGYAQLIVADSDESHKPLAERMIEAINDGNRRSLLCAISDYIEFSQPAKLSPAIDQLLDKGVVRLEADQLLDNNAKTLRGLISEVDNLAALDELAKLESERSNRKTVLKFIERRRGALNKR